ncbi:MAG TPA: prephenate dehydrogenase/arogenate dehydrogenase family protein, partial [Alphaproteobacteria bacterium]|nr:prephenate dehydrogenase/arogenate dehydrogenase family protein [Alphaproteobacteria bacterium]
DKKKLLIIGGGYMGFKLAQAVADSHAIFIVESAPEKHPDLAALKDTHVFGSVREALENGPFEVAVLATPTSQFASLSHELALGLNADCAITDISSAVKSGPDAIVRHAFAKAGNPALIRRYVPSNPQSASSRHETIINIFHHPVFLCEGRGDADAVEKVTALWQAAGANPIRLPSVQSHDELAVLASLWPNVMTFALQLFASGYDLQNGCTDAMHNPKILSEDNMLRLARNMNTNPQRQAVNLQRWDRFLTHHHDDLRFVMLRIAKAFDKRKQVEGSPDLLGGTVKELATITVQEIDGLRERLEAAGYPCSLRDLKDTPVLRHISRIEHAMEITTSHSLVNTKHKTPRGPEDFVQFLRDLAWEFRDANRAKFHVQSAFELFNGMRHSQPVTITPPSTRGRANALQFQA